MDPKKRKLKLNSSSETADAGPTPSPSKMKKKQKLSKSQEIASPSLSKNEMVKAMKKQSNAALVLTSKVISTVAKNSNFVFSPASVNAVLTMSAATSDKEKFKSSIVSFLKSSSIDELNAVFSEISSVVLVDESESGGPKIAAVNGVWIDQSLSVNSSSKDLFVNFFKADFAKVDFKSKAEEVRREVNSWATRHTNGLITDLLPPGSVSRLTTSIYGNALYFKGAWKKIFRKSMTKDKLFYLVDGKSVSVPFMTNYGQQYVRACYDFKVLRLPYRQGHDDTKRNFSMYFYLPDKKGDLDNLLERLTSTRGFLDSHIPRDIVNVREFRIPKFKIECGFEVSSVFSDFEFNVSLYQKALIDVDEEGTEAAAVTAQFATTGCRAPKVPPPIDFVADHPFLFLIREDQTGTVLFAGQIFDPSMKSS